MPLRCVQLKPLLPSATHGLVTVIVSALSPAAGLKPSPAQPGVRRNYLIIPATVWQSALGVVVCILLTRLPLFSSFF